MAQLKYQQIKTWLKSEAKKPGATKKMPTVREIQRHFGVSQAPVSKALQELEHEGIIRRQQGSGITAVTSQPVRLESPSKKKLRTIVFAYPMYRSELVWNMLHTFEQCATQNQFQLCHYARNKGESLDGLTTQLSTCENLCGIIVNTGAERLTQDELSKLASFKVPVVLTDNLFKYDLPRNVFSLYPDMYGRAYATAEYLLACGHRRIGVVRNEPLDDVYGDYRKGFIDVLKQSDIDAECFFFSTSIKSWDSAPEAAQSVTRDNQDTIKNEGISALAYYSTAGAFASIQTMALAGIKVPDQMSIVGGAEYWYAQYANPALTCFTCDYQQLLQDSFAIASCNAEGFAQETSYKPELIERNSVMRLQSCKDNFSQLSRNIRT